MMTQLLVGVTVALMMFAIGLKASWAEFRWVLHERRLLGMGFLLNVVGIPVLTWGVCVLSGLPRDAQVGILLCGACPGGPVGVLFAVRAGGHVALSTTLMLILSSVSVVATPLCLSLILPESPDAGVDAPIVKMMATLALTQGLPLLVGLGLKGRAPERAERLAGPATALANVGLLALVVGLLLTQGQVLTALGVRGALVPLTLVAAGLWLGGRLSKGMRVPLPGVSQGLAMITGARNLSLALLLASAYFPATQTTAAVLTYGLVMMVLPLLAGHWMKPGPSAHTPAV